MADNSSRQTPPSNTALLLLVGLGIPFVFLVFVVYFFGIGNQSSVEKMQLASGEWAPYSGEELPANGVATAIVTEVLRDIGYDPQYRFMSWSVAEAQAASSKTDAEIRGSFPYIKTQEREKRFYYSDPIMDYELTAFYNVRGNPQAADIKTSDDLRAFQIMRIAGYDYPSAIKQYIKPDALKASDTEAAFSAIANSDDKWVVIEAREVGNLLLEQKRPDLALTLRAAPLRTFVDLHLILSMKNPNNRTLRDDFNRALARFKDNSDAFAAFQQNVKRRIDLARAVQLEPYDEHGIVRAFADAHRSKTILLPRGSRGIVKQWDRGFLEESATDISKLDTLVRIKLLNGPLKNQEFYVDGRAVHLP